MYVLRNDAGEIVGLFANLQPGVADEYLETDSVEIAEFYARLNRKKDDANDA